MKDALAYLVLSASVFTVIWRARAKLLYGCDVMLALARGLYGKKNLYLDDGFKPVHEEVVAKELSVKGEIPKGLSGMYSRNGPNPQLHPTGGYHWFDGDGMVHAVRIKDGTVTYTNKFVRTQRFMKEKELGYPAYAKFGDMRGMGYFVQMFLQGVKYTTRVLSKKESASHGNTSLVFHAQRLMALEEGGLPYQLRTACSALLDTIGQVSFGGKLQHAFTAHPKIDAVSKYMFSFGYSVESKPYCMRSVYDPAGNLIIDHPVDTPKPLMMHDCAMTQSYFVVLAPPLLFQPEAIAKGRLPFVFDKSEPLRFGLLPRMDADATNLRWFEFPPQVMFHTAAAFEDGDTVKLYACAFDEFSLDLDDGHETDSAPMLYEYSMNVRTGQTGVRLMDKTLYGDFPVIPARFAGQKVRYTYLAVMEEKDKAPLFTGAAKVDLSANGDACCVGKIQLPAGRHGGEFQFVPASSSKDAAEDDGYLVTFVYDEATDKSDFVVYDARTMSSTPLATVPLPVRVPHGFHGLWVGEQELKGAE